VPARAYGVYVAIYAGHVLEHVTGMVIGSWRIAMAFRAAEAAGCLVDVASSAGNTGDAALIIRPVTFGARSRFDQGRGLVA